MSDLIIWDEDYVEALYIRFSPTNEDEIRRYLRHYELDLANLGMELEADGLVEYYSVCSYNFGDLLIKSEDMGYPIEEDYDEE